MKVPPGKKSRAAATIGATLAKPPRNAEPRLPCVTKGNLAVVAQVEAPELQLPARPTHAPEELAEQGVGIHCSPACAATANQMTIEVAVAICLCTADDVEMIYEEEAIQLERDLDREVSPIWTRIPTRRLQWSQDQFSMIWQRLF